MTRRTTFVERFADVVRGHGDRAAVVECGESAMTYAQLHEDALAIAGELRRRGIVRERVVALSLGRSALHVAGMLGAWYAGAAFVPVDANLPAERVGFICRKADVALALTNGGDAIELFESLGVEAIDPSTIEVAASEAAATERATASPAVPALDDLAYVIFTSGSTGQPKGVAVTHRGIVAMLADQIDAFALSPGKRYLWMLSPSFDASISDIGVSLLSGATLHIEPPELLRAVDRLAGAIARRKITHVDLPPALLPLLDADAVGDALETIIIGGEICPPAVVRAWSQRVRLINVYGPTEATICTNLSRCDGAWDRPYIGEPVADVGCHLLDDELRPVGDGEPAELYLSGSTLARGYVGEPALTAAKFITHHGTRLYRTGDRVVRHGDRRIEFLGRVDRQVKVRGMLVAPEEIEQRLCEHADVEEAAVVKQGGGAGGDRLVAFVVRRGGADVTGEQLRDHLLRALPKWMTPHRVELTDALPRNGSGKVDYAALAQRCGVEAVDFACEEVTPSAGARVGAAMETRSVLAELWRRVLAVAHVGDDDDFFALGGDSLAVMKLIVAAEAGGLRIEPEQVMCHPTLRGLAAAIDGMRVNDNALAAADVTNAAAAARCNVNAHAAAAGMTCDELLRDVQPNGWRDELRRTADGGITSRATLAFNAPAQPRNVLLTGVTGFLGSHLLVELLRQSEARIDCLVRAADGDGCSQRVRETLCRFGCDLTEEDWQRINIVPGDLTRERFGLDDERWRDLAASTDTIHHCAADVHMLKSYRQLRPANVDGTRRVVQLMAAGRPKWLHYASTLSVFVAGERIVGRLFEHDELSRAATLHGGYGQTKWAAEAMLRALDGAAGPVTYFRYGLLTGDTQTGRGAATDWLATFMRGLARVGCAPRGCEHLCVDVTPIDYAVAATARLSLADMAQRTPRTYHIANPQHASLAEIIAAIETETAQPIERVGVDAFVARITERIDDSDAAGACLALCRHLPGRETHARHRSLDLFQSTGVEFDVSNTRRGLKGVVQCPRPDQPLLRRYARNALGVAGAPRFGPTGQNLPVHH